MQVFVIILALMLLLGCNSSSTSADNRSREAILPESQKPEQNGTNENPASNSSETNETDSSVSSDTTSTTQSNNMSPSTLSVKPSSGVQNYSGDGTASSPYRLSLHGGESDLSIDLSPSNGSAFTNLAINCVNKPAWMSVDLTEAKIQMFPGSSISESSVVVVCTVTSDNHPDYTINLEIEVLSQPNITIDEGSSWGFGTHNENSLYTKTIHLTNSGDLQATGFGAAFVTDAGNYMFLDGAYPGTGGTCGDKLEGGSSCSMVIGLSFVPGANDDTLRVAYGSNQVDMTLTGTGTAAPSFGAELFHYDGGANWKIMGGCSVGGYDFDDDGIPDFATGLPSTSGTTGAFTIYSGVDGTQIRNTNGSSSDQLGSWLQMVDDLSGDTKPDILVGAPGYDGGSGAYGRLRGFNGATGTQLFQIVGTEAGERFGDRFVQIPDVNNDSIADFAISGPNYDNGGTDRGHVLIYSGADYSTVLYTFNGTEDSGRFGAELDYISDVNGNGVGELLVVAPGTAGGGTLRGTAFVIDISTAEVLYTIYGLADNFQLFHIDNLGDVNADGKEDFAVGTYINSSNQDDQGSVRVISGATGEVMYTLLSPAVAASNIVSDRPFGVGDIDGDGVLDLAVGELRPSPGRVVFYNGRTGKVLMTHTVSGSGTLGASVANVGNVDSSGRNDIMIGDTIYNSVRGQVFIYSNPFP